VHLTDTDNVSIIINAPLTACNPDGDILAGDARSDAIAGGDGNDTLSGHGGNDLIEGGAGSDALSGGSGSNTFHYTSIADAGDTISEFKTGSGHDVLDIKDILSGFVDGVSDPNDFVQLTPSGGDTIVSVDADGTRGWQYLRRVGDLERRRRREHDSGSHNERELGVDQRRALTPAPAFLPLELARLATNN